MPGIESIIVAIVIGIIASLTNRMNENKEKKQQKPDPSAWTDPKNHLPETDLKREAKQMREMSKREYEALKNRVPAQTQKKIEQVVTAVEKTAQTRNTEVKMKKDRRAELKVKIKDSSPSLDFSEDDIVKGFILSEVLGPPKARRKK